MYSHRAVFTTKLFARLTRAHADEVVPSVMFLLKTGETWASKQEDEKTFFSYALSYCKIVGRIRSFDFLYYVLACVNERSKQFHFSKGIEARQRRNCTKFDKRKISLYTFGHNMDEEQKTETPEQTENPIPAPRQPTTPLQPMKKGKGKKKGLVFLLVVAAIGVGIFLIVRGSSGPKSEPSPTPDSNLYGFETSEPTSTPGPIDREDISIQILNGTGIAKEASFLQGKLAGLGYTDVDMSNAEEQDYETAQVTFSSDTPDEVVDEITEELEDIYKDVETTTSRSLEDVNVEIITGLRKGQTPKPEGTATPEPEETETPTPTESPEPSPNETE